MSNKWIFTNLNKRTETNLCKFEVDFKPYNFKRDTFANNSKRVALDIAGKHEKIYVSYSGGLDSEYVLKTFHDLGINVTPLILTTPYNEIEYEYAFKFCERNNIKPEIVNYDKIGILKELYKRTTKNGLYSVLGGIPLLMCDLVSQVGGVLVTGYGDPCPVTPEVPHEVLKTFLQISEWDYYLDTYAPTHPSGFLSYDPGIFYSLLKEMKYGMASQVGKSKLYGLQYREKMFWKKEFYIIFGQLKCEIHDDDYSYWIEKDDLLEILEPYAQS